MAGTNDFAFFRCRSIHTGGRGGGVQNQAETMPSGQYRYQKSTFPEKDLSRIWRRGCNEALFQWEKKGLFSEKGGGNSVNEGFRKDFYRKGNSVKRSGPFSEPPGSENSKVAVFMMTSRSRKSALKFIGNKNWTQTFFFLKTFRAPPGISRQKSPGYPAQKVWFPLGFEGHTELFGPPPPFVWETPTPPENTRAQKFRFGFVFRAFLLKSLMSGKKCFVRNSVGWVADVQEKDVWDFHAESGAQVLAVLFLRFLKRKSEFKRKMSGAKRPGGPQTTFFQTSAAFWFWGRKMPVPHFGRLGFFWFFLQRKTLPCPWNSSFLGGGGWGSIWGFWGTRDRQCQSYSMGAGTFLIKLGNLKISPKFFSLQLFSWTSARHVRAKNACDFSRLWRAWGNSFWGPLDIFGRVETLGNLRGPPKPPLLTNPCSELIWGAFLLTEGEISCADSPCWLALVFCLRLLKSFLLPVGRRLGAPRLHLYFKKLSTDVLGTSLKVGRPIYASLFCYLHGPPPSQNHGLEPWSWTPSEPWSWTSPLQPLLCSVL